MKTLWVWICASKKSVAAFAVTFVLGLLSMGFLGVGLYYLVAPVLLLRYPPQTQWHGDWVWPALIGVGIGWSFGFLLAGAADAILIRWQPPKALRRVVYLGVLWLWALLIWFVTLESSST